jgi:hypothetical protein
MSKKKPCGIYYNSNYLLFNPNRGLRKFTLLMSKSYIAKHPMNVNATTKMNFTVVDTFKGNIRNDPR